MFPPGRRPGMTTIDLPDGQFAHARYASFARRVEMSHPVGIDLTPKSAAHLAHPVPHRGALANVTNAGRDAVDAAARARRAALTRTAKSCGPDTPTLVSSSCGAIREGDGRKKARSPGRARSKP